MSLRYLRHAALDLAAWEACVVAATPALPYACAWWLAATAGRWDAVVELDDATGAYRSVLPLPVKRRPWGREVFQPAFTQQLGLLVTAASQHRDVQEYIMLISGHYKRSYQQLNVDNWVETAKSTYIVAQRQTYVLSLAPTYETLVARFAADYRRRLRRNDELPQPLRVTEPNPPTLTALIQLFRQHTDAPAVGLKPYHYQQLEQLYAALRARHLARVLEVRAPDSGELLAGALFVHYADTLLYLFAAASPAGRKASAPLLLLRHHIRQHAGTPGLVLDFEGGMLPAIARFFANFGATPVPYLTLTQPHLPWYLQWLS